MDNVAFRQIEDEIALRELREFRVESMLEVESQIRKKDFHLRPFANSEVTDERMMDIRRNFLSSLGIPEGEIKNTKISSSEFDRIVVRNIQSILYDLNEYDASQKWVWNYLTIRVLLDVAHIRFPANADERYLGEVRNTFRRLWQRANMLGPELASQLQEDEGVQIFERTESLGSSVPISIALAKSIIEIRETERSSSESIAKLIKESTKGLRRSMFIYNLHAMSDEQVQSFVRESMHETWKNLNLQRN